MSMECPIPTLGNGVYYKKQTGAKENDKVKLLGIVPSEQAQPFQGVTGTDKVMGHDGGSLRPSMEC